METNTNHTKTIISAIIVIAAVVVLGLFLRNAAKKAEIPQDPVAVDTTQTGDALTDPIPTQPMDQSTLNLQAGETFLAENKTKEGVQTTASGLQYKVLKLGTGQKPKATNTVRVHYEGRLINGTVFDSSYQRGESIEFPLNGVIAGWTEGVQLMPTGSKFQFYIPANLAYGERGAGASIGPNETLIFDVELLAIVK